jgi:hypothetical protein
MISLSSSTGSLSVDLVIEQLVDPRGAQRLAQLLFATSTGAVLAASTGVAS